MNSLNNADEKRFLETCQTLVNEQDEVNVKIKRGVRR